MRISGMPASPVHVASSTSCEGIIIARTLALTISWFFLSRLPGAGPPADEPEAGAPALAAPAALDAPAALEAEAALDDDAGAACSSPVGGGGSLVRSYGLPSIVSVVLSIGTARSKVDRKSVV